MRYYIFNQVGLIGNPNGYKTFIGAHRQTQIKSSKVYSDIWKNRNENDNFAFSIKLIYSDIFGNKSENNKVFFE